MNSKRPYKHILKNLFHEQAAEIIPLLFPQYRLEEILDVEMPDLKAVYHEGPPSDLEQGIVGLVLPEAQVVGSYETEWIEHSGNFERAYRVQGAETDKPTYMVIEFQLEREDEKLARRLLFHLVHVLNLHAVAKIEPENDDVDDEHPGTVLNKGYYVYPAVLCPFPHAVPAPIRDEFQGQVTLTFDFMILALWDTDAREFLNTRVSAVSFLLPAMKNADAALLGLAIEDLAQRFQGDERELGRHLTGMHLLLQESETMSEEQKLASQVHFKRFAHLIKDDPYDE